MQQKEHAVDLSYNNIISIEKSLFGILTLSVHKITGVYIHV